MNAVGKLKDIGGIFFGVACIILIAIAGFSILYGMAELSVWALEWASSIFALVSLLCLLVFLPLAIIPPTRGFAGNCIYAASYVFGLILWVLAMAYTYSVWGLIAVVIGLVIAGVGVVPIAILATIFEGEWGVLGNIVLLIILTFGLRIFGYWLIEKAAERAIMKAAANTESDPPEVTLRQD